jgi:hypothetical protein
LDVGPAIPRTGLALICFFRRQASLRLNRRSMRPTPVFYIVFIRHQPTSAGCSVLVRALLCASEPIVQVTLPSPVQSRPYTSTASSELMYCIPNGRARCTFPKQSLLLALGLPDTAMKETAILDFNLLQLRQPHSARRSLIRPDAQWTNAVIGMSGVCVTVDAASRRYGYDHMDPPVAT